MTKRNSRIALWSLCSLTFIGSFVFSSCSNDAQKDDTKAPKEAKIASKDNKTLTNGGLKVAYVDTDSVMLQYEMAKDMEAEFKAYYKREEDALIAKQKKFEADYANYMKNGASLTLTQQQQTEKELTQRGAELQQLQPQIMAKLQERQVADNKKLMDAVYAFIKDYNKKHQQFDIILVKSAVLYIDESMDITKEIIKGLNEEYKEYKKNK